MRQQTKPRTTIANSLCEAIGIILAIGVLLAPPVMLVAITQPSGLTEPERLPIPDDIPLMTEQEKALALVDGVGAYTYRGMHYVDHDLPAEYWLE